MHQVVCASALTDALLQKLLKSRFLSFKLPAELFCLFLLNCGLLQLPFELPDFLVEEVVVVFFLSLQSIELFFQVQVGSVVNSWLCFNVGSLLRTTAAWGLSSEIVEQVVDINAGLSLVVSYSLTCIKVLELLIIQELSDFL